MKAIFLRAALAVSIFAVSIQAQAFSFRSHEGSYFTSRQQVQAQCGGVYQGWDGACYQDCAIARWYSEYGAYYGYVQVRDNWGNVRWVEKWQERTWWYYNWENGTRRVSCW